MGTPLEFRESIEPVTMGTNNNQWEPVLTSGNQKEATEEDEETRRA